MCRTGNDINNVFDIITLKYWYCILNCTSVQEVQATLQEDEICQCSLSWVRILV